MKKSFLLLTLWVTASQVFAQTIFTYGGTPVSKIEFLRAYNKNKIPVTDQQKSYNEYLTLYARFKLKVKAAQELRMDTLQQLKNDMQNFSSQIEESYLKDDNRTTTLLDEVIARSQKDIHLIHFYVPLNNKTSVADSLKAVNAINEVLAALKNNTTNYGAIANEISKKYTGITADDIGFVTVFSLPYNIENLVYGIKPGAVTKVYQSKSGLHVFKNIEERKTVGKWSVGQILLAIPPNVSETQLKEIEKKADSIYTLLKDGASFSAMAKQFSEDKLTGNGGGIMPDFGTGKYQLGFETKVFELQKDGEISKPFYTIYGYHIVKRLQKHQTPNDKTDETYVTGLKQKIEKDSRADAAKEDFLKNISTKVGFKQNVTINDAELFKYADSITANKIIGNYPVKNKIIFSFSKGAIKGNDWLNFIKDYKLNVDVYKGENNKQLLNKFTSISILEYYRKHLAEYNEEFRYQMQEFKEGNMLFEIMEKKVWGKASVDSIALQNYYQTHIQKYKWDSSATVLLFSCSDLKVANEAVEALNSGIDWKQIAIKSGDKIQSDSGRYDLSQLQLPLPLNTVIKNGFVSSPVVNTSDNTANFIKVLKLYPNNEQRTFNDARGLVINDYQNYLEDNWIIELKKKYPIKINEAVLHSLSH